MSWNILVKREITDPLFGHIYCVFSFITFNFLHREHFKVKGMKHEIQVINMSGELDRHYFDIEKEIVTRSFHIIPKAVTYYEKEMSFK